MNLITRLRTLEARIYAADTHEAPKYVAQLQDALYEAWPKLLDLYEASNNLIVYACPPKSTWLDDLDNALDALEGGTDEVD